MRNTFTKEKITILSKNSNIARCCPKTVRYKKSFKLEALKQYHEEGLSAVGIFQAADIDLALIGKRTPNRLMNQWYNAPGVKHQISPPSNKDKTNIRIERVKSKRETNKLEAKIAYLEAENHFLAILRARKRK